MRCAAMRCVKNYRNVICLPRIRSLKALIALCFGQKRAACCLWRSRIADRYNAPRSVSRVRSGFYDDGVRRLPVTV